MTPAERRERFNLLSEIGCCICRKPAEIHHCKGHEFGCGIGLKADDKYTIPLCYDHHRGANGYHTLGKRTWEGRYNSQSAMLEWTNERLDEF